MCERRAADTSSYFSLYDQRQKCVLAYRETTGAQEMPKCRCSITADQRAAAHSCRYILKKDRKVAKNASGKS